MMSRFTMLLEYVLLTIPVFMFIVKVQQWTGDYLVLAFFCLTSVVKGAVTWLYPRVIHPLTASKQRFPEKYRRVEEELKAVCDKVGFNMEKLWLEQSYDYDMHGNAALASDTILLGKPMLKQHADHVDEIVAIIAHELGHWKEYHVFWHCVVDTAYMVVFGCFLMLF